MQKEYKEEVTSDGIVTGMQEEISDQTIEEPFNPRDIHITSRTVAIDQIIRRMNTGTIRLAPDFQRNEVWDDTKKSRLIESLMLNIPLPMFYVSSDVDGIWDVVDGLQRLSAIKEFFIDKTLVLKHLEFWQAYEGKGLDDFSPILYNRVFDTQFSMIVIEPGTPDAVKYNVFKRINTGGVSLTAQEIRHALYQGRGTVLLKDFSVLPEFLEATACSVSDKRMGARELILRCLAFMLVGPDGFAGHDSMDNFLRKGLQLLNFLNARQILIEKRVFTEEEMHSVRIASYAELETLFRKSMRRNMVLFGENAFRVSGQGEKRAPINKALFETLGTLFAFMPEDDFSIINKNKAKFVEEFDRLKQQEKFYFSVSRDAGKKSSVDYRFSELSRFVQEFLHA